MEYALFVLGFVILILGANVLVDGASSIGRRMNMSSVVIGFTIVALGTSLPELIINTFAAYRGETELAITNVMGSNIMNTMFIIGVSAFIFPVIPGKNTMKTLVPVSFFAAIVMGVFANISIIDPGHGKIISSIEGLIMLLLLVGYLYLTYRFSKSESDLVPEDIKTYSTFRSLLLIGAGVAGLYFGGNWVVNGAVRIAFDFGMSKATVGITIIAVATSLPELVTSMIAAFKKNSGLALGNALGSNIFNVFLVLGISSVIRPLPFDPGMNVDALVMIVSNLMIVFFVYAGKGHKITRTEGITLALSYLLYLAWLVLRNG